MWEGVPDVGSDTAFELYSQEVFDRGGYVGDSD